MELINEQAMDFGDVIARASSATYIDSDNILQTVGNNVARPKFNEITGAFEGIYAEAAATNLVGVNAENLAAARSGSNGWYTGTDLASVFSVVANSTDFPAVDGRSTSVTKFQRTSNAASEGLFARNTPGSNIPAGDYVQSIWVYVPTQTGINNFQLGMDIGNIAPPGFAFSGVIDVFDRWVRVAVPLTTNATATFFDYRIIVNGNGNAPPPTNFILYAMNAQIEAGNEATSFIATAGGTRAAETFTAPSTATVIHSTVPRDTTTYPDWTAGSYATGVNRVVGNYIYRSTKDNNTDEPTAGANLATPSWVNFGPVNRYSMFDLTRGSDTTTSQNGGIEVFIYMPASYTSVTLLNLAARSTLVEVYDRVNDNLIYTNEVDLVTAQNIDTFYEWFFTQRALDGRFVDRNVLGRPGTILRVRVMNENALATIGKMVAGTSINIGTILNKPKVQTISFARRVRDEFGNSSVTPGRVVRLINYRVAIGRDELDYVTTLIAERSAAGTNSVYIGHPDFPVTVLYGFVQKYDLTVERSEFSEYTLTIEGL